jgi:hypothetical protein
MPAILDNIRRIPALRSQDRDIERLEQRQFAVAARKGRSKLALDDAASLKCDALLGLRHASPSDLLDAPGGAGQC